MDDICTYQLRVRGSLEAADIEAFCPTGLQTEPVGHDTLLTLQTDQAGLIGLIRKLHGLGLFLLTITCLSASDPTPNC